MLIRNQVPWLLVILIAFPLLRGSPPPGSWQLEFEDNFEGSKLDGSKWKVGQHFGGIAGRGGNNPDNISVSGGSLKLTATTESTVFNGKSFSCSTGEVSTFFNFRQQYGYMEARMKWPSVKGLWPAFWMMPDRGNYGNPYFYNRGFLKFDLSSAEIDDVSEATLKLTISDIDSSEGENRNVLVFKVDDDSWTESTINWGNQPVWDPLFIEQIFNPSGGPGGVVSIDVTEYVLEESNGDKIISFAMADTFMNTEMVSFYSSEAADSANRPQLIVNGVVYNPVDDAHVNLGNPNSNYGNSTSIDVSNAWGNTASTSNGGMEFDIMETLGIYGPNVISHVLHWDGYDPGHPASGWGQIPVENTADYHTYGVYWEEGRIEFYTDGQLTGVFADSRAMDVAAYLILSLQLGGWDGNDPTSAVNNMTLEVDYVRVWSGTKTPVASPNTRVDPGGNVSLGNDYSVYSAQGIKGLNVVSEDGDSVTLNGNSWIKFPIIHEVVADTVLEFTVDSNDTGEILGIGFEEDGELLNDKRIFQLGGSSTWSNAWQDSNDYIPGSGPMTYSIRVGEFYTGTMANLVIAADDDANASVSATFSGIRFTSAVGDDDANTVNIGELGNGIGAVDDRTGTGYLMYSAENVISRFNAYTGNASHIIAVYYQDDQWYADTNFGQTAFTPLLTDVLLASVNFSNDTVVSLEGSSATENGIASGYVSGDLIYMADSWGGNNNDGEFEVAGTGFTPNPGVPLPAPASVISVGDLNYGVDALSSRVGSGYLMFSEENVLTRFNPNRNNAEHLIAVTYTGGQWQYDNGSTLIPFTPKPSDVLMAKIDFRNDTIEPLEGVSEIKHGMAKGYVSGDLVYAENIWNSNPKNGDFGVTGTVFELVQGDASELYNLWASQQNWGSVALPERSSSHDPDNDGVSNFFEFAFGLNPLAHSVPPRIEIEQEVMESSSVLNTVHYPKHIPGLDYTVQFSLDMKNWTKLGVSAETHDPSSHSAYRQLLVSSSESTVFFRLVVGEIDSD